MRGRENGQQLEKSKGDYTNTITSVTKDNLVAIGDYRYDEGLRIRKNGIAPTVRSEYKSQDHSKSALLIRDARIRRLTPLECERLQGFPDNWTELGVEDNWTDKDLDWIEISDTQRYKMCGNAVTVNVVEAVMKRLINDKGKICE